MRHRLLIVLGIFALPTLALPADHISTDELRKVRLPEIVLESVTPINADGQKKGNARAHIQVQGVIGEHIHFELLLPDDWNGRFTMGGGGGFVGTVQNAARDSVNKGYATVGTDTGHQYQP